VPPPETETTRNRLAELLDDYEHDVDDQTINGGEHTTTSVVEAEVYVDHDADLPPPPPPPPDYIDQVTDRPTRPDGMGP